MRACSRCTARIGWEGIAWEPLLCPLCSEPNIPHGAVGGAPDLPGLRILAHIGTGGMSRVYLAHNEELDRYEAVKVLSAENRMTEALARFEREASIAGKLQHANLVQVYRLAQHKGLWYLTMPYVPGPSMAQVMSWTREHPHGFQLWRSLLAPDHGPAAGRGSSRLLQSPDDEYRDTLHECCRKVSQLARGLHAVHAAGVVHRDIKPGNILVDPNGQLVLMDFGLARVRGGRDVSQPGQVVGTPGYMSPEQINPSIFGLDHRTDIYSLGASLFSLALGEPPFRVVGEDYHALFRRIASHPPPTPRSIRRGFPRDLEDVLLKTLEKNADSRYPTAQAFADDLERFVHFEPISGRRTRIGGRIQRLGLRWRREMRAAAVIVAIGVLALGVFSWIRAREVSAATRQWAEVATAARSRIESGTSALRRAEALYVGGAVRQADQWKQHAEKDLRGARDLLSGWIDKHGSHDALVRIRSEIDVHEQLFAALEAAQFGSVFLAEQQYRQAIESAGTDPELLELCNQESGSQLAFSSFEGCARASLKRAPPVELDGTVAEPDLLAGVDIKLPSSGKRVLPTPGRWQLEIVDAANRIWTFPIWIAKPGRTAQRIEVPIDPKECETRHPGTVLVPGGIARLGSDWDTTSELRRGGRESYVPAFLISVREVTVGEYEEFLDAPGAPEKFIALARQELPHFTTSVELGPLRTLGWRSDAEVDVSELNLPIVGLSVIEALAYAKWKGGRLPTEDEWEKAARGTWGHLYPQGDELEPEAIDALVGLRPVGSRPFDRSPYGVLDMLANAGEWTSTVHWIDSLEVEDWSTLASQQLALGNRLAAREAYARAIKVADDQKESEEAAMLRSRLKKIPRPTEEDTALDAELYAAQRAWFGNVKSAAVVIKGQFATADLPRPPLVRCDFSRTGSADPSVGFRVAFDVQE